MARNNIKVQAHARQRKAFEDQQRRDAEAKQAALEKSEDEAATGEEPDFFKTLNPLQQRAFVSCDLDVEGFSEMTNEEKLSKINKLIEAARVL